MIYKQFSDSINIAIAFIPDAFVLRFLNILINKSLNTKKTIFSYIDGSICF